MSFCPSLQPFLDPCFPHTLSFLLWAIALHPTCKHLTTNAAYFLFFLRQSVLPLQMEWSSSALMTVLIKVDHSRTSGQRRIDVILLRNFTCLFRSSVMFHCAFGNRRDHSLVLLSWSAPSCPKNGIHCCDVPGLVFFTSTSEFDSALFRAFSTHLPMWWLCWSQPSTLLIFLTVVSLQHWTLLFRAWQLIVAKLKLDFLVKMIKNVLENQFSAFGKFDFHYCLLTN